MDQPVVESIVSEASTHDQAVSDIEGLLDQSEGVDESAQLSDDDEGQQQAQESNDDEAEESAESEEDDSELEESEEAEPEAEEQADIETLSDLAEALEQTPEELLANLKASVKVDGQESLVTLQELVSGYQKDADYRHKTTELADNRRAFEAQATAQAQQVQNQLVQLGQFMQMAEQAFVPQLDSQQMADLRITDPAEYAARRQEMADKMQLIQSIKQQAANEFARNNEAMGQQSLAQQRELMAKEHESLLSAIPTWGAETKKSLDTYLADNFDFSDADLSQIADHRQVLIAHKAMLYDKQQKEVDVAKKKVKTLPKLQKPAKPQGNVGVRRSSLSQAQARLRKSGRQDDAAKVIEHLLS